MQATTPQNTGSEAFQPVPADDITDAPESPVTSAAAVTSRETILIVYTTKYREGGREMAVAAQHLAAQKQTHFPTAVVRLRQIESKAEFLAALAEASEAGQTLRELHFIGHSGLYGPMFGTRGHPEQMSRFEWGQTAIPFGPDAEAFFHCCRSGRWFAPFFSRHYGVVAHGYQSYTTFSRTPERYVPVGDDLDAAPVYVISAPGYKAMGLRGLIRKRLLGGKTIPLQRFAPQREAEPDGSYNPIAELYDAVFEDFRVRYDEWQWLSRQLKDLDGRAELLDIGCGNGALLLALAPLLRTGTGVDAARRMIEIAQRRASGEANLDFVQIDGPRLPFPDSSRDVIVSMLSWRYLDWDPMTAEIQRVLRPGGRLLIVDMVVAPFQLKALPRVVGDKARAVGRSMRQPNFRRMLKNMVEDPRWNEMLQHNPMRAEHEMRWYLPSRFAGGQFDTLNRAPRTEILAFRWDKPNE